MDITKNFLFLRYEIVEYTLQTKNLLIVDGLHLSINSNLNVSSKNDSTEYELLLAISILDKSDQKNLITKLETKSLFIDPENSFRTPFSEEITDELLQISYNTSRGILLSKVSNSQLKELVLPIVSKETLRGGSKTTTNVKTL